MIVAKAPYKAKSYHCTAFPRHKASTPVRGDTTAGIVSTEACRRALLRFHKFSARLRGSRLVPEADMASQRSYTTGDASQVREANDVFRPRDG
jgi:hypothetical protein